MDTKVITLGPFEIRIVEFGTLRLDGGAMFGSAPKTIWSKKIPADDRNRIPLAARGLLIDVDDRRFLVDVGCGDKWNDKLRDIYAIETISEEDVPQRVTDVILTHLHFDHAGGITRTRPDGSLELTYPGARIHVQEENARIASSPGPKERASYLPDNVAALALADTHLLKGDCEVFPGIRVHRVDGHTQGQQWIEITHGADSIVFPTDLIPTSHHLHPAFHMGYDMCAATVLEEKQRFFQRAGERNARIVFQHDPLIAELRLVREGDDWKGIPV